MADEHEEAPPQRPFDIESAISSLIARNNNDARMALRTLSEDNYQYRRTIRNLKKQVEDLKKRPELKDGEVIVAADRAKLLTDFEALKVKVEDVKTGLEERNNLKTQVTKQKKADEIAKGAKPLKLKPDVLADLIDNRQYQHSLQDVEIPDEESEEEDAVKTIKVLHLRKKDDEPWTPADKFAERELKGYLPALRVRTRDDDEESAQDEEDRESTRERDEQPRRPFPRQASGTGSKAPRNSNDVVDKHIRGRYVAPSKLRETQNH